MKRMLWVFLSTLLILPMQMQPQRFLPGNWVSSYRDARNWTELLVSVYLNSWCATERQQDPSAAPEQAKPELTAKADLLMPVSPATETTPVLCKMKLEPQPPQLSKSISVIVEQVRPRMAMKEVQLKQCELRLKEEDVRIMMDNLETAKGIRSAVEKQLRFVKVQLSKHAA